MRPDDFPEDFIKDNFVTSNNRSHTEPLALSALYTLSLDDFQDLLPEGYNLQYYEVHFISTNDACGSCAKNLFRGIECLRKRFKKNNLFVFFHGLVPYGVSYTVKFKDTAHQWKGVEAGLGDVGFKANLSSVGGELLKQRSQKNFDVPPPYYICILKELENLIMDWEKMGEKKGRHYGYSITNTYKGPSESDDEEDD